MPDSRQLATSPEQPTATRPEPAVEARRVRQAAALRANLGRRKQQARARDGAVVEDVDAEAEAPCR